MVCLLAAFGCCTSFDPNEATYSSLLSAIIVTGIVMTGWIHTLLEEAENERMHLLTFMHLKQPGILFRLAVLFTQVCHLALHSNGDVNPPSLNTTQCALH